MRTHSLVLCCAVGFIGATTASVAVAAEDLAASAIKQTRTAAEAALIKAYVASGDHPAVTTALQAGKVGVAKPVPAAPAAPGPIKGACTTGMVEAKGTSSAAKGKFVPAKYTTSVTLRARLASGAKIPGPKPAAALPWTFISVPSGPDTAAAGPGGKAGPAKVQPVLVGPKGN